MKKKVIFSGKISEALKKRLITQKELDEAGNSEDYNNGYEQGFKDGVNSEKNRVPFNGSSDEDFIKEKGDVGA